MKTDSFRAFAEYYDWFYLKRKDYEKEAKLVKEIVRRVEQKKSKTLLDAGCGTGEHLKYLSNDFQCVGMDLNKRMIEVATRKVPKTKFKVANMVNFRFTDKFDVIISLFSSIGYVQTFKKLVKTLDNFHKYLNDKGVVILEPWIFKKDFKKRHISLDTHEDEKAKLVRMATSRIRSSTWSIFMHYLVGKKGKIEHFTEIHRMLALNQSDYVKAFESAGFKETEYITENLWSQCRGLFVATR